MRTRGILIALLLAAPFFVRAEEPVAASLRAELAGPRLAAVDFYGETYRVPVNSQLAIFERLRLNLNYHVLALSPYFELNQERLDSWQRVNAELGLARVFAGQTRFSLGLSRRGLDRNGAESSSQLRSGLSSGAFWRVDGSRLFAELYGEGFAIAPAESKGFLAANGWVKSGYRAFEQNHLILDPLVFELRGAGNSDKSQAGPDYLAASIGPRLSAWMANPALRASLFISRSRVLSASQQYEDRPYWFLFSLGGEF